MEFAKGLVVRAKAGRDKDGFFVVLSVDGDFAVICDGKRRKLETPKRKNQKHLSVTNTVLEEQAMQTNREIRKALAPFQNAAHSST